jgi:hypothetical protein
MIASTAQIRETIVERPPLKRRNASEQMPRTSAATASPLPGS